MNEPVERRLHHILPGNLGIYQTVEHIKRMVRGELEGTTTAGPLNWKQVVRNILAPVHDASTTIKAGTLYQWVQDHMTYTPDDIEVEEISRPSLLFHQIAQSGRGKGDCDDYVVLLATLFGAARIPYRIVTTSAREDREYDHIFLKVLTERGWMTADGIHGEAFGWEVPQEAVTNRREYE